MERKRKKRIKKVNRDNPKKRKKRIKKIKEIGTPQWIQNSVEFNQNIEISADANSVVTDLFNELISGRKISGRKIYQKEQKLKDLGILIANLTTNKHKAISIRMNRNVWETKKQHKFNKASPFILKLIKSLDKKDYINMKRGYINEEESRNTRIWATNKLLKICRKLPEYVITTPPKEVVLLKDEKGKLKDYKDTQFTLSLRKTIEKTNEVNSNADIEIGDEKLNVWLRAIFKGDFKHGGRLYSYGHRHFQGYKGRERKEFTINGEPVVEYDFSSLHPHLLYAMEGIQLKEDPYLAVVNDSKLRDYMKLTLLKMINGKSKKYVIKNINYEINFQKPDKKALLKNVGIEDAEELVEKFMEAHKPIEQYLCNGEKNGLQIFNKDAKITYAIIKHFATREIPILPVHDSFVVQEQHGEELKQFMEHVYRKKTGGFYCPVKKA